ncbi:MAG: GNAT family N-acetyltransferase [Paludibacter sp.]
MILFKCFNGLPIEYESFLLERYDSYITTCQYVQIYYPMHDINYMLVYDDNNLIELMLFGNKGSTATCFNSLVNIEQDIVERFTIELFMQFPSIKKIQIIASYKSYDLNRSFLNFQSDDQILDLPGTVEDYYLELGAKTRKHIKQRKERLIKEFESVNFVVKYGEEIEKSVVDKIMQMSTKRMKSKGRKTERCEITVNNTYKFSQSYGCVAYIEVNGEIIAGCIASSLNKAVYAHVLAHDEAFFKYNPGDACIFFLIQTSIEKGMSVFHFLWGKMEYKRRLLAKSNLLYSYSVYRTYSLNYVFSKIKAIDFNFFIRIKNSELSKPLREAIKSYRKRTWKT